jgi:hypothetical protein
MPLSKKAAAKLNKRVLRAAGAGELAELQQLVAAATAAAAADDGAAAAACTVPPPLLECADADECQPLVSGMPRRPKELAPCLAVCSSALSRRCRCSTARRLPGTRTWCSTCL